MREAAGLGRSVKNLQLVPVHAHGRFHMGAFIRPAVHSAATAGSALCWGNVDAGTA